MKVQEVLAEVEELKPNQFKDDMLIRWLNDLESRIYQELLVNYIYEEELPEYVSLTKDDTERELCVPEGYTDIYKYYLFAMIDFHNNEIVRYQNSQMMFEVQYQSFVNYWNRTHRHKGPYKYKL